MIIGFRTRFPAMLCQLRTSQGKQLSRAGFDTFKCKSLYPRMDGISNCLTGVLKDNLIIYLNDINMRPEYKPNPTKDDLRDYFAPRVAVRKMTCVEAMRLMDVDDSDIQKIIGYPFSTLQEKNEWIENQNNRIQELQAKMSALDPRSAERKEIRATLKETKKNIKDTKDKFISKTSVYKLAGNSIVVSCLYWLFFKMFIDTSAPQQEQPVPIQKTLFN
ncbi:MAG: hypothetical protein NC548_47565 [Lachnospiraceae bacterium]|nr:hypothetical protein [Lachnospiraceae bacterium]